MMLMTTITPEILEKMKAVTDPRCKWVGVSDEFWSFLENGVEHSFWQVSSAQLRCWTQPHKSAQLESLISALPVADMDIPSFEVGIGSHRERYMGGQSGTGLYGDQESRYEKSWNNDQEFAELDRILNYFWPDMAIGVFKQIKPLITEQRNRQEQGYYATTSDYEDDFIDALKVFRVLKFADKLTPNPQAMVSWEEVVNPPAPKQPQARKSRKGRSA